MTEFPLVSLDEGGELSLTHSGEDPMIVRAKIMQLTQALLALPGEHIDMPVEHTFAQGMYVRKLLIKKGTFLIGKIHRKECINIVSKGDITVLTESGSMRVQAGFTIVSPVGIQKVGYAHEDTEFINVFLTDETDIEKLEAEIACESFEALEDLTVIEGVILCQ